MTGGRTKKGDDSHGGRVAKGPGERGGHHRGKPVWKNRLGDEEARH